MHLVRGDPPVSIIVPKHEPEECLVSHSRNNPALYGLKIVRYRHLMKSVDIAIKKL